MQLNINFDLPESKIPLSEFFDAYFECRQNKRNTVNAQLFEVNYEEKLVELWKEINSRTYRINRSIAFVVEKPVKREVFAADFRDRIVHHWVIGKLNPLIEKELIYDSYSCRKEKGTLFGVKRLNRFIRACSDNYTRDVYILKLDLKGFFMSIDRKILYRKLEKFIYDRYSASDRDVLLYLIHKIIMNDCTQDCHRKSPKSKWAGLPPGKSLFGNPGCGLPIGNLTSQIFANFYLSSFDHWMKSTLHFRYYGRYVDDFFIVHQDRELLQNSIPRIASYLKEELAITLHPAKQYLQHFSKGIKFTGAFLLPNRIYIDRRTKGNFYALIRQWNKKIRNRTGPERLSVEEQKKFQSSVNSYLGFMLHYRTFRLRKRQLYRMSACFDRYFRPANAYKKLASRTQKKKK
jgi:hypothetical protein